MNEEQKKHLVCDIQYVWDGGIPCSVGGWKNDFVSVSPATGWFYGIRWDDLARIAETDRNIDPRRFCCWISSKAWWGYMTDEQADECRKKWREQQRQGNES